MAVPRMRFISSYLCFLPLKIYFAHTTPDVSLYLQAVLRNHTAQACDGDTLAVECPPGTSAAVHSAFYGRLVPHRHLCPSSRAAADDTACASPVAVEKVWSECHGRRSCRIPVRSAVFGQDPCPLTSKYLLVSFKCRPERHRTRLVCENERLRLTCKDEAVLVIYSATFGRELHGGPNCPREAASHTDMECLSPSALRTVSRRCHGRASCSILAETQTFGDPCFPGTRKHLRVSFTCVPRYLLENVGRGSTDPFLISDYTHGGWYTGPTYRPNSLLFTSSLEMMEKILGLPERAALYFVLGICAGLVFLLCLLGPRSTPVRDFKGLVSELNDELKATRGRRKELTEDDDVSDTSSFHPLTQSYHTMDTYGSSILTLEMLECKVDRIRDLPNGDMWPHQNCSPYAYNI